MSTPGSPTQRLLLAGLLVAIALGAFLRTFLLGESLVVGDEIHLVATVGFGFEELFGRFRFPDNCMPITAFARALMLTVGLDEWGMRIPAFVPGILLVALVPFLARPFLAGPERVLLALLLATSPVLIYWSRMARPYSLVALASVLAVACLAKWLAERRVRWAVGSALAQAMMFWASPTTAPALAGLTLAGAIWAASERGLTIRGRAVAASRAALPAVLAAAFVTVGLWRALPSLLEASARSGGENGDAVVPMTFVRSAMMLYGFVASEEPSLRVLVLVPVILAAYGLYRWCRVHPRLAVPTLVFLFLPMVAFAARRFWAIHLAEVFVRYQAATVPFFLFLPVYGFAALARTFGAVPRLAVGASALAGLVVLGPLASGLPPRAPFGLRHSRLHRQWELGSDVDRSRMPEFYRRVAGEPGAVLVECTSTSLTEYRFAAYQRLHGRRVVRLHGPGRRPEGMELSTLVLGLESLPELAPEGAYVVLHKQSTVEWIWTVSGQRTKRRRRTDPDLRFFKKAAPLCEEWFGAPVHDDEWLRVFRCVRPAASAPSGSGATSDDDSSS